MADQPTTDLVSLQHFEYTSLPTVLHERLAPIYDAASTAINTIPTGGQQQTALQLLLSVRDMVMKAEQ